jgi:DNA-binding HxlR family transcriptional regulator
LSAISRDTVAPSRFQSGGRYLKCSEVWYRLGDRPVRISVGTLGRKWTPLIMLAIGTGRVDRFNRLLVTITGIPPKVLARRLRELERGGMVRRIAPNASTRFVRWVLTPKGKDAFAIILMVVAFGSKHHAAEIYEDKRPRRLHEIVGASEMRLVRSLL